MFKLLIADDEQTHRHTLKKLLKDFNQNSILISEAKDGKEALQLFSNTTFDAVFTDIIMPSIDGLSLLKEIHSKDNNIPVILVSSYSNFEYAKQAIKYGAFDYIVKPFDKEKLIIPLLKLKDHLENTATSRRDKENTERVLAEILDFGIKEDYENIVYTLILNDAKEFDLYLDKLIANHLSLCNYDNFKLGITFELLLKNIEEKLLETYKFANKIYSTKNFSKEYFFSKSEAEISEIVKKEFSRISEFIHLLHLNQSDNIVKKLCEYAMNESEKRPTLDEAAVLLNYNSDYLGKLFKLKTGESFSQFSAKIKLEQAKKLLKEKIYKNYEICDILGYKDIGYFSKLFKEYTGMTPSEYRKSFEQEV